MKSIVIALFATLLVTGCLFSKKEEAPAEAPAMEEAAPAEAAPADAAPAAEPAPAE
jgi:3-hexulose-6-phosphate synthase